MDGHSFFQDLWTRIMRKKNRQALWLVFISASLILGHKIDAPVFATESNTYTDAQYKFSFSYPVGWTVVPGHIVDPTIPLWEVRVIAPSEHYLAFSVMVRPLQTETQTTNDFAESLSSNHQAKIEHTIVLNGLPAIRVDEERISSVYVTKSGLGYSLALLEYGDNPEHQTLTGTIGLTSISLANFEKFLQSVTLSAQASTPTTQYLTQALTPFAEADSFRKPLDSGNEVFGYAGHPNFWQGQWSDCYKTYKQNLFHQAEDWAAPAGTLVKAVANGVVDWYDPNYANWPGRVVIIRHTLPGGGTIYSLYGHLDSVSVTSGQTVQKGDAIGTIIYQTLEGKNNSHLHWEMRTLADGPYPCTGTRHEGRGYSYPEHPNGLGFSDPSDFVAQHQTGGQACLGPSLISPTDGQTLSDHTVTFSWQALSSCSFNGYTFRVKNTADMESGGTLLRDTGEGNTSHTETLAAQWDGQDLYWGVRAANASNGAAWSVRRFRVQPAPPPPGGNDTTPPTATGYNVSISGGTAYLSLSSVSDNSSGVREARFNAKWNGAWHSVGIVYNSAYSLNWDMCAAGVPDGDIEFGAELWDNANNKWVWSEHYGNPHGTKSYNCTPPPPPAPSNGVQFYSDPGYSGWYIIDPVTNDIPNLGQYSYNFNWHDQIESIKIYGQFAYVLYENENYSGAHLYQTGSQNLNDQGWGNRADSIRIRNGDYNASAFTLYGLGDFNGEAWSSDRIIYDLGHWEKNDWAESMRVGTGYGVIACIDADFHGICGRATGPSAFSDINALAQGLRHGVSSVRVCNAGCPNGADTPYLFAPDNETHLTAGNSIVLQWYGNGGAFRGELWGGALGGTQTWGWDDRTQYAAGNLAASSNPYYWRIQANNGYGDSGWAQGSFYVDIPTISVVGASVSRSTGAAPLVNDPQNSSDIAAPQGDFNYNDPVDLIITTKNTIGADAVAHFVWSVFDPLGRAVPSLGWEGDLTTRNGTWFWYLKRVLPAYALTGGYTFRAEIAYDGLTSSQSVYFTVQGPETVESISIYSSDENGLASDVGSTSVAEGRPHLPRTLKTNFNAGDKLRMNLKIFNSAGYSLPVKITWWAIDPQNRITPNLFRSGTYTTGTGLWTWWYWNVIPSDAISGDYHLYGSVEYNRRITVVSTTITIQGPPPPVADDFDSPEIIGALPFETTLDTWGASQSVDDPFATCTMQMNSNSVWYRITPSQSGRLVFDSTGSTYDTVIAAYVGGRGNLNEVTCSDDAYWGAGPSRVEFTVSPGATYYIAVSDWYLPGGGTLQLQAGFPPSADDFDRASVVSQLPYTDNLDTRFAGQAEDDPIIPGCSLLSGWRSVWYRYVPTQSGFVQIDTLGSNYDTQISVWRGTRGNLQEVACNDDMGGTPHNWLSRVKVYLNANQTYYVQIAQYAGALSEDLAPTSPQTIKEDWFPLKDRDDPASYQTYSLGLSAITRDLQINLTPTLGQMYLPLIVNTH